MPQKIRESCNACASSKVRCSKDQPSCVRCSNRQLYCQYSLSRRTGKRRAVSDEPTTSTSTDSEASFALDNSSWTCEVDTRITQYSSPVSTGVRGSSQTLSDMQFDQLNDDPFFPNDIVSFVADSESENFTHSSAATAEGTVGYIGHSTYEPNALFHSTNSESTGADSTSSVLGSFHHGSAALEHMISGSAVPPASTCSNTSYEKPLDCMSFAINTFKSLHIGPSTCSLASGSPHTATPLTSPTIDHVLATNQSVLDSLSKILVCSCSHNAQLALILSLIGSKIVAWYRAILKKDEDSCEDGRPRDFNSTAERVLHSPVTVGKYKLDGADEDKMRAQLVLSELRRVALLVEQLAKHSGEEELGNAAIGKDNDIENQRKLVPLYEQLQVFLTDGIRSVANEAMRILRNT